MPHPLRPLAQPFSAEQWPAVSCPSCDHGTLVTDEKLPLEHHWDARSKRAQANPDWDPEWVAGTFAGWLRCARCGEVVAVCGSMYVDQDVISDADGQYMGWYDAYRLQFTRPALKVVRCPAKTPEEVLAACRSASALIWADPSAAANRLRLAVEELLTALRIARYPRAGPRGRGLSTHARIERLEPVKPEVASALMAVKWIGNDGSHDGTLTANDVLDGVEMLEHALTLLYDTKDDIRRRIAAVNRTKGLKRR